MPMDVSRYPQNWKEISLARRQAANWQCEWCKAKQGEQRISKRTGKPYKVVLTVAHVGENRHDKMDCSSLVALCQACHLRYDLPDHIQHAKETRERKKQEQLEQSGQQALWEQ